MIRPALDRKVLDFFSAGLWIKRLLDIFNQAILIRQHFSSIHTSKSSYKLSAKFNALKYSQILRRPKFVIFADGLYGKAQSGGNSTRQ